MKYLLLLAILFLSGCFYQNVDHVTLKAVHNLCETGVYSISSQFNGAHTAICSSGKLLKDDEIYKESRRISLELSK